MTVQGRRRFPTIVLSHDTAHASLAGAGSPGAGRGSVNPRRLGSSEIGRLVEVRMTRQEVLRRAQAPLKLTAIVNESVLRRRVGNA